jgi:hypothetical protein
MSSVLAIRLNVAIAGAVHGNIGGHIALNQRGLPVFDHTITVFLQVCS